MTFSEDRDFMEFPLPNVEKNLVDERFFGFLGFLGFFGFPGLSG